ncbi:MAG: NADH-quinone oxidoreductase subunit M [Anaerolineaceae bacterium]|nr:NADH-quinone oxidoreductase subunit M [Anaerolineaceae bacterium]
MSIGINPLTWVIFSPLIGALILLFLRKSQLKAIRWTALFASLLTLALTIWVVVQFYPSAVGYQLSEDVLWFSILGLDIHYALGVDGLALLMVLLTSFLVPIALLSTWSAVQTQVKSFMIVFLLLEVGMNGVFLAQDMILFYLFWEFTLIPMIFLIGIWGGENRRYAAVKFFIFTLAGSLLMLLAMLYMGNQVGSFALADVMTSSALFRDVQVWLFMAFALAFAIKVPMWPLHTWLPDAHVEAPTAGSVILAGVLLKMGAYGLIRFNLGLFPEASVRFAPWLAGLAVVGILYGAAVAFAQKDMKKLVAYSSVSHLGFVVLGIFAFTDLGLSGAVLQMVNHGISTGALFLIVGMLYERRHSRLMSDFGGVWKIYPIFGGIALISILSSMGLPGLNGFVGEFTILVGSFGSEVLGSIWFTVLAALGVILAALYLLKLFEKVFLGPLADETKKALTPISTREMIILIPLIILMFWIGLYPQFFLDLINPSMHQLSDMLQQVALTVH